MELRPGAGLARRSSCVGVMGEIDRHRLQAWVDRSCARQGVPTKVTDEAVLRAVCVLLGASGGAAARSRVSGSTVEPPEHSEPPDRFDPFDVDLPGTGRPTGDHRMI